MLAIKIFSINRLMLIKYFHPQIFYIRFNYFECNYLFNNFDYKDYQVCKSLKVLSHLIAISHPRDQRSLLTTNYPRWVRVERVGWPTVMQGGGAANTLKLELSMTHLDGWLSNWSGDNKLCLELTHSAEASRNFSSSYLVSVKNNK